MYDCQIYQRVRNNKCRFSIQERVSRDNREHYSWLVCKAQISVEEAPKRSLEHVTIGAKRGRPLLLSDDLYFKLRSFPTNLRSASGTKNKHVLYGVLMGLTKSDLSRYGRYLKWVCVTDGWVQSLYTRMGYTRRMVSTSQPVITVVVLVYRYALISLILNFYPLSRVNFLYWEAYLPTNPVNLSRANFL